MLGASVVAHQIRGIEPFLATGGVLLASVAAKLVRTFIDYREQASEPPREISYLMEIERRFK